MCLDVVCIIDPRFEGGTAAAMASDVSAFLDAGLTVGIVEVTSPYLSDATAMRSRVMSDLVQDSRLQVLDVTQAPAIRADAAFFHHPMTFFYGIETGFRIKARTSFLVAHHLPFRGDGSLQYDPVVTSWRLYRRTGVWPVWAPVSGICRQQLQSFAPFIRLSSEDWPNVFDVSDWEPERKAFSESRLVIGRHGRADLLKWPETPAQIRASLPALPDTQIRVMGAPEAEFEAMGIDTSDWTLLPFNAEPVSSFLDRLDVFIYQFHPNSSESFGRTVAEAMLMGAVCILDPRLEPTFGDLAIYAPPEETTSVLERLRTDPASARRLADRAQEVTRTRHNLSSVPARLEAMMAAGPAPRLGQVRAAPPVEVLRKTVGMIRRGEYFLSQLASRV